MKTPTRWKSTCLSPNPKQRTANVVLNLEVLIFVVAKSRGDHIHCTPEHLGALQGSDGRGAPEAAIPVCRPT